MPNRTIGYFCIHERLICNKFCRQGFTIHNSVALATTLNVTDIEQQAQGVAADKNPKYRWIKIFSEKKSDLIQKCTQEQMLYRKIGAT